MGSITVGAYDAKTHLPRLLDRVAGGEDVTITRHGRPVAHLVPANPTPAAPEITIAALRAARAKVTTGGESIRDMIDEGRR